MPPPPDFDSKPPLSVLYGRRERRFVPKQPAGPKPCGSYAPFRPRLSAVVTGHVPSFSLRVFVFGVVTHARRAKVNGFIIYLNHVLFVWLGGARQVVHIAASSPPPGTP